MPGLLQNHIAVVTGAGSGIGRAIAHGYAREGAAVAALDVNGEPAAETAKSIRGAGGKAEALTLDVTDRAACRAAAAEVEKRFGRISVLVNNAGITRRNPFTADADTVATDWQALYPKAPADLVPAAYSISGLFDLTPLVGVSMNQDLRLDDRSARDASPLDWPAPKGRVLDAVVGSLESSEFLRQSRVIAEAWSKGGAQARFEAIAGRTLATIKAIVEDRDPRFDPDGRPRS